MSILNTRRYCFFEQPQSWNVFLLVITFFGTSLWNNMLFGERVPAFGASPGIATITTTATDDNGVADSCASFNQIRGFWMIRITKDTR